MTETKRVSCRRCGGEGRLRAGGRSGYYSCDACQGNGYKEVPIANKNRINKLQSNRPITVGQKINRNEETAGWNNNQRTNGRRGNNDQRINKNDRNIVDITSQQDRSANITDDRNDRQTHNINQRNRDSSSEDVGTRRNNVINVTRTQENNTREHRISQTTTRTQPTSRSADVEEIDLIVDSRDHHTSSNKDNRDKNNRNNLDKTKSVVVERQRDEDGTKLNVSINCTYIAKICSIVFIIVGILLIIANKSTGAFIVGIFFLLSGLLLGISVFGEKCSEIIKGNSG